MISCYYLFLFFFFFSVSAFAINSIYEGYKTSSTAQDIDVWSKCKTVYRISGNDVFVPTKTSTEWDAFIANHPGGIYVSDCPTGGTVINGSCATNHYYCNSGTSINQLDNANDWTWTCQGSNGGSSPDCLENKVIACYSDGVCDAVHYGCNYSYGPSNQTETSSEYTWTCSKDGCSSHSCSEAKTGSDGECGLNHYNCNTGNSINNSSNSDDWTWTCQGIGSGIDVSCYESKPVCQEIIQCYYYNNSYFDAILCDGDYNTCSNNGLKTCEAADCSNGDWYCFDENEYKQYCV